MKKADPITKEVMLNVLTTKVWRPITDKEDLKQYVL